MRSNWEVAENKPGQPLVIRDMNQGGMSVTNDAENVVDALRKHGLLPAGRRLFYYDSECQLDEILVNESGFVGFAPIAREMYP